MPRDKIKMNYELMAAMAKTFHQGEDQLKDTQSEIKNLASMLSDGALLGQAGSAFADALNDKLAPAIDKLSQKFGELEGDIRAAVDYMQGSDDTAEQLMSN